MKENHKITIIFHNGTSSVTNDAYYSIEGGCFILTQGISNNVYKVEDISSFELAPVDREVPTA